MLRMFHVAVVLTLLALDVYTLFIPTLFPNPQAEWFRYFAVYAGAVVMLVCTIFAHFCLLRLRDSQ